MHEFKAKRITQTYRQTIHAAPEKVFPLLCPVQEANWLDGWHYKMIYSDSGIVEEGAVFTTPLEGEDDTVWIVTKYDAKERKVEFVRFTHQSRTCVLRIAVEGKDNNRSFVDISYVYTGITPEGNVFLDNFTHKGFLEAVSFWEKSMNYFLKTGKKLRRN